MMVTTYPLFEIIPLMIVPIVVVMVALAIDLLDAAWDYHHEKINPIQNRPASERTRTE